MSTDEQVPQTVDENVKTLQRKPTEVARRNGSVQDVIDALKADPLYTTVSDILHWRDPVRSGLVFAIITLAWFLLSVAQYSAVTLIAYLYLGLFVISFGLVQYSNFSGKPHLLRSRLTEINDVITREEAVSHAEVAYRFIDATVLLARDALFFTDVTFSLKVFGTVGALAITSNYVTLPTILFADTVLLFIIPRVYEEKKVDIDALIAKGFAAANEKVGPVFAKVPFEKLKLKQE